jgi:glycosyltransferase involved in cell wall biosynthesis
MEKLGKKLMVLSVAPHSYNKENAPVSYEPYVREMNLWSELFDEVEIYTLVEPYDSKLNHKFAAFKYSNVKLINLLSFDASKGFFQKVGVIFSLPIVTIQLALALKKYDVVNIRNSGFFSAILGLLTRLFNKRTVTKWAGSYMRNEGENYITELDRKVINMYHKKHKVLVYDKVYKDHFVNFIPALMSNEEIERAKNISTNKPAIEKSLEIIAIGRLYWAKNFELIFDALNILNKDSSNNFTWHFHMIGDGALREKLETMMNDYGLNNKVTFHGALPFNQAQLLLAKSHVLIMPGIMEGWPKPIAEAWAHNVYPLGANKGNVPDIITSQEKGIAFHPTEEGLVDAIKKANIFLSEEGSQIDFTKFIHEYSLEEFQKRLIEIIKNL